MELTPTPEWTYRGLRLVVQQHESVFQFEVIRAESSAVVATGFATSLEVARAKAERAADAAVTTPFALPT